MLRLEGPKSDKVVLADNDPRRFTKPYVCADGPSETEVLFKPD